MTKDILVIGGGLSGLYLAHRLQQRHDDYKITILESRSRLGGRLESVPTQTPTSSHSDAFDLGGSWFWPSTQPNLSSLIDELGLESFSQHEQGDLLIERSQSRQAQRLDPRTAGMGDARRLKGGMQSLVQALADKFGSNSIHLKHQVTELRLDSSGSKVQVRCSNGASFEADHVVLAIPPRLAASSRINFVPSLPKDVGTSWSGTPTWMAPHAKYLAVYSSPFWREQNLSGNAHSTAGPLGEIHDASNDNASLGALFGFFSIPSSARQAQTEEELKLVCRSQLVRLFGEQANTPLNDWIRDWALEKDTATEEDRLVGMPITKRVGSLKITPEKDESGWNRVLVGAGSEWSPKFPGYIAGAIDAADRAIAVLES